MTDAVSVLIVDDEPLARANLRHALASHAHWRVVDEASSVAQARTRLAAHDIDVVLLDIQMPGESGVVLAREMGALPEPPLVVLVTAFDSYAVEAFELHALDYLLKPFDDARLTQAVQRADALLAMRERASYGIALRGYLTDVGTAGAPDASRYLARLSVRSVGKVESVAVEEVRWIRAAGNYVELHLARRVMLHRVTLATLERRLDPATFLRVHRSAMVRRDEIDTLVVTGDGTYQLRLRSGSRVAVSERYVARVREAMGE